MVGVKASFKPYKSFEPIKVAHRVLFRVAVKGMNYWKNNLDKGLGATGNHGRPYRDTGEAVSDITIQPQGEGSTEYIVGGDVIQLAIAEFGRVPTPGRLPPFRPIAAWCERKGLTYRGDEKYFVVVNAVRRKIAEKGLSGFAPGRLAIQQSKLDLENDFKSETDEAIKNVSHSA